MNMAVREGEGETRDRDALNWEGTYMQIQTKCHIGVQAMRHLMQEAGTVSTRSMHTWNKSFKKKYVTSSINYLRIIQTS